MLKDVGRVFVTHLLSAFALICMKHVSLTVVNCIECYIDNNTRFEKYRRAQMEQYELQRRRRVRIAEVHIFSCKFTR